MQLSKSITLIPSDQKTTAESLNNMKMFPKFLGSGAVVVAALALSVSTTQAQTTAGLINVDFNGNGVGTAYSGGGVASGPSQTGAALIGSAGDSWNGFDDSAFTFSSFPDNPSASGLALKYADGSASGVTMSLTAGGSYNANEPNWGNTSAFTTAGSPYSSLMQDLLYTTAVSTITLSGLAANQTFDLILYSAGDQNLSGATAKVATFTVNGITQTSSWNGITSTLIAGQTYVEFASAMSDASGNLVINFGGTPAGTGINTETDLNGFQLIPVPEPSTWAILGLASMMMVGMRRRVARS